MSNEKILSMINEARELSVEDYMLYKCLMLASGKFNGNAYKFMVAFFEIVDSKRPLLIEMKGSAAV